MPTQAAIDNLLSNARTAAERGDQLLHLQIEVATLVGQQSSWGSSGAGVHPDDTVGPFVSHVEAYGWALEHTGYSFVETGSSTSAKIFGTGEGRVNADVAPSSACAGTATAVARITADSAELRGASPLLFY